LGNKISFGDLLTGKIAEKWYMSQTNFLLPFLVLLENPLWFLVAILPYTILGMIVGFNKGEQRVNSFVLAIYPFLFHCCFLIFYWAESHGLLVITQLICLGVLLLGSIHHTLTLFYEILHAIFKLVRQLCKNGKIQPTNPTNEDVQQKRNTTFSSPTVKPLDKNKKFSVADVGTSKINFKVKMDKSVKRDKNIKVCFNSPDL
jgi:hypothetical protein